jgi:hypothetical protein
MQPKALLSEIGARKMLMKLTPVFSLSSILIRTGPMKDLLGTGQTIDSEIQ